MYISVSALDSAVTTSHRTVIQKFRVILSFVTHLPKTSIKDSEERPEMPMLSGADAGLLIAVFGGGLIAMMFASLVKCLENWLRCIFRVRTRLAFGSLLAYSYTVLCLAHPASTK